MDKLIKLSLYIIAGLTITGFVLEEIEKQKNASPRKIISSQDSEKKTNSQLIAKKSELVIKNTIVIPKEQNVKNKELPN